MVDVLAPQTHRRACFRPTRCQPHRPATDQCIRPTTSLIENLETEERRAGACRTDRSVERGLESTEFRSWSTTLDWQRRVACPEPRRVERLNSRCSFLPQKKRTSCQALLRIRVQCRCRIAGGGDMSAVIVDGHRTGWRLSDRAWITEGLQAKA